MSQVQFGNKIINYNIIRSNRKTLGLEVNLEEGVLVRAPKNTDKDRIKKIVTKKAEWITRKLKEFDEVKPSPAPKEFMSGEKLLYIGRRYRIKLINKDINNVSVKLFQGKFIIEANNNLSDEKRRIKIRNEVENWYRKHAKEKITERVNKYIKQVGENPNNIKIKKQKKRWGSCSSIGNLNFNWKLIMAPMSIIDYIVVHELVHLKYPNHSKDFWNLVEAIIPDYQKKQKWLKINGKRLDLR